MMRAEWLEERLQSLRIAPADRAAPRWARGNAAILSLATAVAVAGVVLAISAATRLPAINAGESANALAGDTPSAAAASVPGQPAPASTGFVLAGYVKARRLVQVGSAVSGVVQEILARPGDRVRRGQKLAELANGPLVALVEQTRATLAAREAELAELRRGARAEELEQADMRVMELQHSLNKARLDLDRRRSLAESGLIARQDLDNAGYDVSILEARLRATEQDRQLLRSGARIERLDRAQAQVAEARAALSMTRAQLEHSVIRSPIDGVVVQRYLEVGELVSAGFGGGAQAALMAVADTSALIVEIDVPDSDLPRVHAGQRVRVESDAVAGKAFDGRVTWISPQANRHSLSVAIEIEVLGDTSGLLPGLSAKVTFDDRQR